MKNSTGIMIGLGLGLVAVYYTKKAASAVTDNVVEAAVAVEGVRQETALSLSDWFARLSGMDERERRILGPDVRGGL